MFSFFPPLLIVLALAGIIVIVLRRTPEIRRQKFPRLSRKLVFVLLQKTARGVKWAGNQVWRYILEVKEVGSKARIHFPRPQLPQLRRLFRSAESPEFFLQQAEEELEHQNYAEAERKFIKVIEKDPHNAQAYSGLGKLYLAQKKYEEAAQTFKFLTKHYPEVDGYYSSLGRSYHGLKLYEQAVAAFERAIELAPDIPKRYVNLGITLEAQKHVEEAILNYRRAVEMEKDNTQFLIVLAEALAKKGDKDEAEVLLEQILVLEPTNHLAREKLMALKF